ncbi:dentin sialophosphoprotein-like [Musca domestica]|uniref:Dentin sialophosphoprotein-like n=1 Tax=Musca domestica TaxID=7370 RepID=A0A1I8NAI9_MUSDO|nr:dentin sialophosphoprotein-like [Musca domestica]
MANKLFIALFLYTTTIAIADVSLLNKEYLPPFPYFKTIYKTADSSSIFTSDSSFLASGANFNGDFEKLIDVDAPAIDSTKTDSTDSTVHNIPLSFSTKSNTDDSESSLETENTAGSTGESSFSVSSILPEPGSFLSRLSIGSSASGSLTPVTSDDILSFSSSSSVQEDTKNSDEVTLSSNTDLSEDTSFSISYDSGSLTSSIFTESSTTEDLNTDTSATHISNAVTTSSSSSPLPKDDSNISVASSTTVTTSSVNSTNDNSLDLDSDTNIDTISGDKSAPAITISTKSSDSELNDSSSNSDKVGTVYAAGGGYIY